jgi:hypothetical protein
VRIFRINRPQQRARQTLEKTDQQTAPIWRTLSPVPGHSKGLPNAASQGNNSYI